MAANDHGLPPEQPDLVLRAADGRPLDEAFNVDDEVEAEIGRNGSPFKLLYELKLQDNRLWVSPWTSLRMYVHLESKVESERSQG